MLSRLLEQVIGHFVMDYLGPQALLAGTLIAVVFWFIDTSIIEFFGKRFAYSITCAIIAIGLSALLSIPEWSWSLLVKSLALGALFYAPIFMWMRKSKRSV